jgi:hypothetical protein
VVDSGFEHRSDKVCQLLVAGRWFSQGTPVSSTNTTDRHDIAEILLKVVLNTISLNQTLTVNMLRMLDMMVDIHFVFLML